MSLGVGGRMLDVLQRRGFSVSAVGIGEKGPLLEGDPSLGRTVDVLPASDVNTLTRKSFTANENGLPAIEETLKYLNKETDLKTSGVFSNYWSQNRESKQ